MHAYGKESVSRLIGVAAFIIFATGCVSTGTASPRFTGGRRDQAERILVEVANIGWADAAVYSVTGGSRIRLGTVGSNQTGRFKLPRNHVWAPDLHLEADPIGSAQVYGSEIVAASPGQVVRWTIHETRSFRSLVVR